ncbi:oxysterol binding protein [Coniophora puteana RWD-64-598 SS2]|uniref:Oxysterol binding protein n=1 Tax=Coniophora puteana (strain RWD-64-598) TaxID=741705 RepID=A0A5M3MBS4_CONPW|nr:oxysterol binding protein [Coniophora puteana RWD-64-598 SS2]EIW76682.1 oxysterol binding protein [Coniophora puteana RWD-64-598 SS2]
MVCVLNAVCRILRSCRAYNYQQAVPAAQKSTWASFVKSLASVSGDLSSMTAPPFILSPTSLTEFPAYWNERPALFAAIADGKTEEDRALAVLKWFISTLKSQYTSRNESMGSEKKPLNPVLGELFYGMWPDAPDRGGVTTLVVEQVSHHPPITAFRIENKAKGVVLTGHNAQKTSFSAGSIIVKQVGHALLTVQTAEGALEEYIITLPKLRIDGIWYGSPYIELTDTSYIQSSTGWLSTVDYKGKGYFSGKTHQFKATVTKDGMTKHVIDGLWHTTSKDTTTGATFHDVSSPKEEVVVAPLEEQGEWESRKLWFNVAKGIREGNYDAASKDKTRIEVDQRKRRQTEREAGTTWELKHFTHLDNDPVYERLYKLFKGTGLPEKEDVYVYRDNGPHP